MTPERYKEVKQIFEIAVACETGRRAAFVAEACRDDEELRGEVESLLAHDEAEFIEESAFEVTARSLANNENKIVENRRIGAYKIIREINRGGMGAVYLAERADEQFKKQVAIKLIKRGLETKEISRRFRHERQILATLDHPNIARLIDGGTTEDGSPFFVMEYVEGVPIDEYCETHKLSVVERLKLFRMVCAAVQYAHQNLVIHRDLKPSNILVTKDGTPKLLDFGIAKLLNPEFSQTAGHTITELRILTPEYASPEQVRGENITIASDVYSLGVILYELLAGRRPYRITSRQPDEMARAICDQEPKRPSVATVRVTKSLDANEAESSVTKQQTVIVKHSGDLRKLRRALTGDLDNIVLMALRKEPARRYASVAQFSEDIRRHLDGLPVIARRDTFKYRASKFVKRHTAGVAATMLVALSLIAGIIATSRQAKIATEQRDRARLEQAKAERVSAYMQNIFALADPNWYATGRGGKGGEMKAVELLDAAAARLDTELKDQPDVCAELHHTIGNTFRALGDVNRAEQNFRVALALYRELYGERHPKVAENLYYLGATLELKGKHDEGINLYRQAIVLMREADAENVNLPYMLQDLGQVLLVQNDVDVAESLFHEAQNLFRHHYGENHLTVAITYSDFGRIAESRNNLDEAEAMYRKALARLKYLPDSQQSENENTLLHLSRVLMHKGEYREAESLAREALAMTIKFKGEDNYSVVYTLKSLAELYKLMHDTQRAELETRRAVEIERKILAATKKPLAQ
ncbi:MAG: hypothetical protein NVSMB56_16250 [Pyrinomonadaceae bacterium]